MTKEQKVKEKVSIGRLFVQSGLCKRKDPVIDKFYLKIVNALSDQKEELIDSLTNEMLGTYKLDKPPVWLLEWINKRNHF